MKNVVCFVLGGGRGSRLYPLTLRRSEPALPIAGKYRLIDIPVSNCLNSGIDRIYVLTQFQSASLHRHIANTFKLAPFSQGFVEILAAQQTNEATDWFKGTADAVRQQVRYIESDPGDEVLILYGDQLYVMDFRILRENIASTKPISRWPWCRSAERPRPISVSSGWAKTNKSWNWKRNRRPKRLSNV